ncbi:cytochrome C oxidase copper chaperone-domain-containing protein [Hysterangium stoloniferum]|nr:cytochrome C oxidase copper chaperone-domain-containing protein [Hysterangium stoloniferum]
MFSSWIPSSWRSSPAPQEPEKKSTTNPLNPEGLKPCCACPETKSARDECFLKSNPDAADEACRDLVLKHVECMRGYGFKI